MAKPDRRQNRLWNIRTFRGYPAKRALSVMRKHGGSLRPFWQDTIGLFPRNPNPARRAAPVNSSRPSDVHMPQEIMPFYSDNGLSADHQQAIIWTYPDMIINGTHGNKFQRNFNQNRTMCIHWSEFENIVCKLAFILSRFCLVITCTVSHSYPSRRLLSARG